MNDAGYFSAAYADALAEFGRPRELKRSGAWLLERTIPGSERADGMGCYPMLACRDWSQLHLDLAELTPDLVCFSAVTDPFGNHDRASLKRSFPDLVVHFKDHYVTDLSKAPSTYVTSRHARNVKKALAAVTVERCKCPADFLDDWVRLYSVLVERHSIHGLSAFSHESFRKQLAVPGIVMFRASRAGETVGMVLWLVQDHVAYYHLGAYSKVGYELRSSFALFSLAIEYFKQEALHWLNLGAGAGANAAAQSGLDVFKSGWATGTKPVWFCGRVYDREAYDRLAATKNEAPTSYFPAYRKGEFG